MTKDLQQADYAHKIDQHIKNLRYSIDNSFLDLAKALKEVRDKKLYEALNIDTFEGYIAQPELAFDRASVYRFIQIYEFYIEKKNVAPGRLLEAGWTKLGRIIPYTNEANYEVMLEKATTLSRSDLDADLVENGYITKKEPEQARFVEVDCPKCKNHFVWNLQARSDKSFPREDYNEIIEAYKEVKGIEPKGDEYKPIQQSIKTMFLNGRTKEEIIEAIKEMENVEYTWTMQTISKKISEILKDYKPQSKLSKDDEAMLKGVGAI